MTNNEKIKRMTLEQKAEFLSTQRFIGMGKEFVVAWLKEEATK